MTETEFSGLRHGRQRTSPISGDDAPILCNCWYLPDGTRIGYTIADGCQAHPDAQVTDDEVWKP